MSRLSPLLLTVLWSAPAWACSVCGTAKNAQSEAAYILMTGVMSLSPLALVGGLVFAIIYRIRKAERENGRRSELPVSSLPQHGGRTSP